MKFEGLIQSNEVIVHIQNSKEFKNWLNNFEATTKGVLNNIIIKRINTYLKHDTRMFAK